MISCSGPGPAEYKREKNNIKSEGDVTMNPLQQKYQAQIQELADASNRLAELGFVCPCGRMKTCY